MNNSGLFIAGVLVVLIMMGIMIYTVNAEYQVSNTEYQIPSEEVVEDVELEIQDIETIELIMASAQESREKIVELLQSIYIVSQLTVVGVASIAILLFFYNIIKTFM